MRRTWIVLPLLCALVGCGSPQKTTAPTRDLSRNSERPRILHLSPQATPPAAGRYRIQPGDTLFGIAFQHNLDVDELAAWKEIRDPARIQAGEELVLKKPAQAGTRPVPTARPAVAMPAIPVAAKDPVDPPSRWVWPSRGEVVTGFDSDAGRKGIDIANQRGTPVLAAAAGRVVYAGGGLRGYGKLVIIKHSQGMLTAYGHHDQISVKEGDQVVQGQSIGSMGDSDADRVKLHFEIRQAGKPVNPLDYLPSRQG